MNKAVSLLALLAVPLGAAGYLQQGFLQQGFLQQGPGGPPALRVGVVDLSKALAAYPRQAEESKRIDENGERLKAALQVEEKKAAALKLQRDDLQAGTIERMRKDNELRAQMQLIDGLRQISDAEQRRLVDEVYVALFADIEKAVATIAKEQGVDLVVRLHTDVIDGSVNARARLCEARQVWYSAPEIDLTQPLIKLLQLPRPAAAPGDSKDQGGSKPGGD